MQQLREGWRFEPWRRTNASALGRRLQTPAYRDRAGWRFERPGLRGGAIGPRSRPRVPSRYSALRAPDHREGIRRWPRASPRPSRTADKRGRLASMTESHLALHSSFILAPMVHVWRTYPIQPPRSVSRTISLPLLFTITGRWDFGQQKTENDCETHRQWLWRPMACR